MPGEKTITNEQKINAKINPLSAANHPAKIDGIPTWTVQSGDGTVEPAGDGMSAFLVSGDLPGDTIYIVQADADLGAGVVNLADTITLHVEGALAVNLGLSFDEAVAK